MVPAWLGRRYFIYPLVRQTGGGSSSTSPATGTQPDDIEVYGNKAVLVITPALVYDI